MEAKESQAVEQKRSIAQAAAKLINADDFVFIDAGSTTLELVRALAGDALKASYVTNGVAHARALARKGCRVYLPGGLLRPQTGPLWVHPVTSLQRYNFTKAFMGANGVALDAGFTTPDPEEAAVKAAAVHRAREAWFLVDDAKFSRIYPAVIADLQGGAILTNLYSPQIQTIHAGKGDGSMIYTVTFNPAIDYVVRLDAPLEVGEVNRAKGETACWAARASMCPVCWHSWAAGVALGFVASEVGAWLERGLAAQGLKDRFCASGTGHDPHQCQDQGRAGDRAERRRT